MGLQFGHISQNCESKSDVESKSEQTVLKPSKETIIYMNRETRRKSNLTKNSLNSEVSKMNFITLHTTTVLLMNTPDVDLAGDKRYHAERICVE